MESPNANYWLTETPAVVETTSYVIHFYREARRRQFYLHEYKDRLGRVRPGKNFGIMRDDIVKDDAAISILRDAFGL